MTNRGNIILVSMGVFLIAALVGLLMMVDTTFGQNITPDDTNGQVINQSECEKPDEANRTPGNNCPIDASAEQTPEPKPVPVQVMNTEEDDGQGYIEVCWSVVGEARAWVTAYQNGQMVDSDSVQRGLQDGGCESVGYGGGAMSDIEIGVTASP